MKSLWNRRFSVGLAVLSIAMSVALILGVERLRNEARKGFANSASGIDLIIAARGNDVQILLATVFGVGSTGAGIDTSVLKMVEGLDPVEWAVPIMMGDNHRGFPVIGTTRAYFDRYGQTESGALSFAAGGPFETSDGAVVGAEVAARFGYAPGDVIINAHGSGAVAFDVHDEAPFVISGVLTETGTAVDRMVIVSTEGFDALHQDPDDAEADPLSALASVPEPSDDSHAHEEHHEAGHDAHDDHSHEEHDDHEHGEHDEPGHDAHDDHEHEEHVEEGHEAHEEHGHDSHDDAAHEHEHEPNTINAIYVGLKDKTAVLSIQRMIAEYKTEALSAVLPNVALLALWSITGTAETALQVMAVAVAIAGMIGMVVMLMASLESRRREFAIFRSVGATPGWVCGQIVIEACLVTLVGLVLGVAMLAGVTFVADPILTAQYGFGLGAVVPVDQEWVLLAAIFCFGAVAGLIPAWRVYRMTLADGLAVRL
ncbi:FtsX-like permease family protein [Shimia biformata]|uniref:FtsX-like permease family protein n=1 Tax=Shimia biformata TaxID=1294299 RepID=UPI0023B27ECF|nr:FtsX-like permease family protein [Shimia biformata]